MTTYLLAGGGTAGHVNPLLSVADGLRARDPEAEILVLGTAEGLESRLVPARGYELLTIERLPFPRRPSSYALAFPRRLRAAADEVRAIIRERGVDVVVGFGGYASAPAYFAARSAKVPLVIHEANARPGIANRLGARFTQHVGVTFESTPIRRARVVGQPLRPEITGLDRLAARAQGIEFFGLDASLPTLVVTGGSSGARSINTTIIDSITTILGAGWQVLHITGEYRDAVENPALAGYHVIKYCDRMELALAVADVALGRAGTGTVTEVTALGIPTVFVPYPVGNGEQRLNARDAVRSGGAIVVRDQDFTPRWVGDNLVPLLGDRARIAAMAASIRTVGHLDGTERMIALIDDAVAERPQASTADRK